MVGTVGATLFRQACLEMSWESPPKSPPPHFRDDKRLPGEMVGLTHSQTKRRGKSKELPPNHLNLARKCALLSQCSYPGKMAAPHNSRNISYGFSEFKSLRD